MPIKNKYAFMNGTNLEYDIYYLSKL